MHDDLATYAQKTVKNTTTAIINIFMFLPYFFSVEKMFKTLFKPWKNIFTKKDTPGFSMNEFIQRFGDNFVSRFMGFFIRSTILFSYITVQISYVIFVPFIFAIRIIFIPLTYAFYISNPTPLERKKYAYEQFIKRHLTEEKNKTEIDAWFETYYADTHAKKWWTLESLMSQTPLARDLTSGYTPTLDQFSIELTTAQPHYQHLIGRKAELEHIQQVLSKAGEAHVILSGEEGIGRRTIVEALASAIYSGQSVPALVYHRVLELNMEKILSESTDIVQREEAIAKLFQEAADAKNVIILIDNIDQYISNDTNRIDLTNIIAKYAERPDLQFIAITTPHLYQKYVFSNKPISNLFEKIDVEEVTVDQALKILLDVALILEKKHHVTYSYETIKQAVEKTHQYISSEPLPEKAIALLDEAAVYTKQYLKSPAVTPHVISTVLEQKTHIPTEMSSTVKDKLLNLEEALKKKIVFQTEAIQKLSSALRKSFVMVGTRKKPLASFLFLGPTGVGKTETAKAITEVFFEDKKFMIRFDMSLYQSKDDIKKLIGSSETNEPGLLTQAIRQQRYGTLLLDELEKADHDLLNIFLTILDEGYFSDAYGKRVDCTNLIIIATSNAGAAFIYSYLKEHVNDTTDISSALIDYLVSENYYSPEFLNRFDGTVVFKPLTEEAVGIIAEKMLAAIAEETYKKHSITLTFNDDFIQSLIEKGYDARFGARNMQRIIRDEVEDKVAKALLSNEVIQDSTLTF